MNKYLFAIVIAFGTLFGLSVQAAPVPSDMFSNSGSGVKLSVNFPAEPTVLSAFGRWNALRMVAPRDSGGSMCETRFALSSIA